MLLRILHSDSGVNTLIGLEGADLRGGQGARQGVPARPDRPPPAPRRLLRHRDGQAAHRHGPRPSSRASRRASSSRAASSTSSAARSKSSRLPADIPQHIDIDVTELMLHQGVRVRDLPQDGKWKATSEPDLMIVHVVPPKAEEVVTPDAAAAAAAPGAAAEPEVIKKGKKDEDEGDARPRRRTRSNWRLPMGSRPFRLDVLHEACCWSRQPGSRNTKAPGTTSGSPRSICWRSGTSWNGRRRRAASRRSSPTGGCGGAILAKPLTFMNLSGAAVVGLLQFYKIELADLLVSSTRCSSSSGGCGSGPRDRPAGTTG